MARRSSGKAKAEPVEIPISISEAESVVMQAIWDRVVADGDRRLRVDAQPGSLPDCTNLLRRPSQPARWEGLLVTDRTASNRLSTVG